MKKIVLGLIAAFNMALVVAQDKEEDPKNVVISQFKREFRFVKGNEENPVQIKEESVRTYYCNSYRTEVPVAEFYNDKERIDDVSILVDQSKKHGISPRHEYYNSDGIFYSDARVCYFSLPLSKQGSTSKVTIRKTILDPHYFTSIYFVEQQDVRDQEIRIIVPAWMKVEFKEYNFANYNIKRTVTPGDGETIYTYTASNIPAMRKETSAPGISYYAPHLLVMTKYADPEGVKYTYFNTLKDQYGWYKKLVLEIGNENSSVKEKAEEITKGLTSDEAKVKAIFLWVQENIRYIAFEDGIAGFKPEKAQVVMQKKYGDCKGMANLVTEMLKAVKIDARRCWIGTKHLAYDYSTPSLAVDNHMISVWMNKDKPVYLDATEKYIGFGEVAERIQGRQTLIEDGSNYILGKVPVVSHLQNTAYEKRVLTIDGATLKGHVVQSWKGENKELLLSGLNSIKQDKQQNVLLQYLSDGKTNFEISGLKTENISDYNKDVQVEYDIVWKNVLTEFGKETYLELDNRRNLGSFRIDTSVRKLPYWFYFKNHLVFETEISLPEGKKIATLPAEMAIQQPGYSFSGKYLSNGTKLNYRCEIILNQPEIKPENFSQWNKDISQLQNFYNQQIVLVTK